MSLYILFFLLFIFPILFFLLYYIKIKKNKKIKTNSFEINLNALKSGIYFLNVGDQKLEQSIKIIKK